MAQLLRVWNPRWVKIALILGVPLLAFLGIFVLWIPFESHFAFSVKNVMLLGSGTFLTLIAVPQGVVLLRFMNHELHVEENGLEIRLRKVGKFLPWSEIGRIRVHEISQVFKLYDRSGRLVYAVDFYAENFYSFYEFLKKRLSTP
jgi:hypothetical protein